MSMFGHNARYSRSAEAQGTTSRSLKLRATRPPTTIEPWRTRTV